MQLLLTNTAATEQPMQRQQQRQRTKSTTKTLPMQTQRPRVNNANNECETNEDLMIVCPRQVRLQPAAMTYDVMMTMT